MTLLCLGPLTCGTLGSSSRGRTPLLPSSRATELAYLATISPLLALLWTLLTVPAGGCVATTRTSTSPSTATSLVKARQAVVGKDIMVALPAPLRRKLL